MPTSFKMVGFGLFLTLIGILMVQKDLRLRIWGKEVNAGVMKVWSDGSGLEYLFQNEEGNPVKGSCAVPDGFNPEMDLEVKMIYLPGNSDVHRLASKSAGFSYLLLLAGFGLTALGGWYFTRESVTEAQQQTIEDVEKWKEHPKPKDIIRKGIKGIGGLGGS